MKTSNLSPTRARVLAKVVDLKATRESPLRLHGSEFTVAIWLYEHDLLGMTGACFYPIPKKP